MDVNTADQYYLKALAEFPYDLESVIENLNYTLSYDEEHTQAYCLLGLVNMYAMKDYRKAESCFEKALQCDLSYPDTYKYFSLLKIWLGEMEQANKIINYGLKVKGMDQAALLKYKALAHECIGEFDQAKNVLKQAKLHAIDNCKLTAIDDCLSRIKTKIQLKNKIEAKGKKST